MADACLASYPSLKSTDSYRHATGSSHILFDSSQRADSNSVLLDSIGLLAVEIPFILYVPVHFLLTEYLLLRATDMLLLRVIHYSNRLSERILMRVSPTLADALLASYPSFMSTDSHRHATGSSNIPFDSSQQADSNVCFLTQSVRWLGRYLSFCMCPDTFSYQNVNYWGLLTCYCFEPCTIQIVLVSEFQWGSPRPWRMPAWWATILLSLLTATGMPTVPAIYHSIRPDEQILMNSLLTRPDRWFWSWHPSWRWLP